MTAAIGIHGELIYDAVCSQTGESYFGEYDITSATVSQAFPVPTDYSDWGNRMKLIVSYPPTIEAQASFTLTWQTGMQSAFDDIRFATLNGVEIPHWKETTVASTSCKVWLKLPADDKVIQVLWGNADAEDSSSSDDVFEYFDGFDGTTYDSTKWGFSWVSGSGYSATVANSILTIDTGTVGCALRSSRYFSNGETIIARVMPGSGWNGMSLNGSNTNASSNLAHIAGVHAINSYPGELISANSDGVSYENDTIASNVVNGSTWFDFKIVIDDDRNFSMYADSYSDTEKTYTTSSPLRLIFFGYYNDSISVDYVFSIKTLETTPTITETVADFNPYADGYVWNAMKYSMAVDITDAPTINAAVMYEMNYVSGEGMSTSFADVRFATADGVNIEYWRESYVTGTSAKFWLKLPHDTSRINVYFGNTSAVTAGLEETVYDWYEGFHELDVNNRWSADEFTSEIIDDKLIITDAPEGSYNSLYGLTCTETFPFQNGFKLEIPDIEIDNNIGTAIWNIAIELADSGAAYRTPISAFIKDYLSSQNNARHEAYVESSSYVGSAGDVATIDTQSIVIEKDFNNLVTITIGNTVCLSGVESATTIANLRILIGRATGYNFANSVTIPCIRLSRYIESAPTFTENPVGRNVGYRFYDWTPFEHQSTIIIENAPPMKHLPVKLAIEKADYTLNTDLSDMRFCDKYGNYLPYIVEYDDGTTPIVWTTVPANTNRIYMRNGNSLATSEDDPQVRSQWGDTFDDQNYTINEWSWINEPTIWDVNNTYAGSLYFTFASGDLTPNLKRLFGKNLTDFNARIAFDTSGTGTFTQNYNRIVYKICSGDTENCLYISVQRSYGTREIRLYEYVSGTGTLMTDIITWTTSTSTDDPEFDIRISNGLTTIRYKRGPGDTNWITAVSDFELNKSTYDFDLITESLGGATTASARIYEATVTEYDQVSTAYVLPEGYSPAYYVSDLTGFPYYKSLTVSDAHTANYPVKKIISHETSMETDFSKLEFIDIAGLRCPHWIESYESGVSATVWILTKAGQGTIKMYYGNSGYSSVSNGEQVFKGFIGFEGTSLDSNKVIGNYFRNVDCSVADGSFHVNGTDATYWLYNDTDEGCQVKIRYTPEDNEIITMKTRTDVLGITDMGILSVGIVGADNKIQAVVGIQDDKSGQYALKTFGHNAGTNITADSISSNTWYDSRVKRSGHTTQLEYKEASSDTWNVVDSFRYNPDIDYYSIVATAYASNPFLYNNEIDYIAIHEYVAIEPSISFGSETANPLHTSAVEKILTSANDILQKDLITIGNNINTLNTLQSMNDLLISNQLQIVESILIEGDLTQINSINITKETTTINTVELASHLTTQNDVLILEELMIINDILTSAMIKELTIMNNLFLSQDFTTLNCVEVMRQLTGLNNLCTELELLVTSDILLAQSLTSSQDICQSTEFETLNQVLVELQETIKNTINLSDELESINNILIPRELSIESSIEVLQELPSSNDIILEETFTIINTILTVTVRALLEFNSFVVMSVEFDSETVQEVEFDSLPHMETEQ